MGVRARLVALVVALVVATSVALGVGAYLLVERSLRDRLVEDAVAQANFNVAVLAAERLPTPATRADVEDAGLEAAFRLRGAETYVELADGETYASSFAVQGAARIIDPALRGIAAAGRIGYDWVTVAEEPFLVAAAARPAGGEVFYFFFSAADIDQALDRLRQALLLGGGALILVAALTARAVAGRVLRPVSLASTAARRIADGDLEARLPEEGPDEFGRWAATFNQMAGSLQQTIGALRESQQRQRRFVSDVAHELRTPLTALVNEADLLQGRLRDGGGDAQHIAGLLVDDVHRLRALVDDLLEISRFDAAAEELVEEAFGLRSFMASAVADRLPGTSLRVSDHTVTADRRRLERILGNLLDNAVQHAGTVDVEVEAGVEDGVLRLSVSDRGPGVPAGDLDRIFDRFYKGDPSRRRGSTGLGLAIAREHARLMGGDLTAELRPAGGLRFELRVPVTESLPDSDEGVTEPFHTGGEA